MSQGGSLLAIELYRNGMVDAGISQKVYSGMPYQVELMAPAARFLDSLPLKFRTKAYRSIGLLKEFGPFLREPHSKRVTGQPGLMELRVGLGSDICRMFYFHHRHGVYVITSGYQKKAMKLDRREIRRAAESMRVFLEDSHGED